VRGKNVDEIDCRIFLFFDINNLALVGFGQTENREFSQEERAGRAHNWARLGALLL
jgi:hypothetical protein